MADSFIDMPKIELHCHLDGSLDLKTSLDLLNELGMHYTPDELRREMQVDSSCQNLAEYLQKFVIPNYCLQDEKGLEISSYMLAKNAAMENVKYIEVRFAPTSSQDKGLGLKNIIEAVERGLGKARGEFDIETGIILCMMRGLEDERNLQVVRAGMEFLGCGVVACDIAGDEASFPMSNHISLFNEIKRMGMAFTIHVGETGNATNVRDAIEIGAKRLGHGIAMAHDKTLMRQCADANVGVELCPTSNIQTRAYNNISDCPIMEFINHEIKVSINTDNRTVSSTTLSKEFERIDDAFHLDEDTLSKIYSDSVEMSFAPDDVKDALLKKW